jgi:hypothetical protein
MKSVNFWVDAFFFVDLFPFVDLSGITKLQRLYHEDPQRNHKDSQSPIIRLNINHVHFKFPISNFQSLLSIIKF